MLRWLMLGLLAVATLPAWAAKRVSVVQVEHTLSTLARAHRTDLETAMEIGELDPSQRISDAVLVQLIKHYAHGPETSLALQLLADRSSFLPLPQDEVPSTPAPNAATQQKLLEMARKFALQTLPQLPNLFATRTTYSFDNSPRQIKKDTWPVATGLHLVGITKSEVNIRNEKENIAAALPESRQPKGLMTWGEFGSALLMVIDDSAKGTTTWSHWEQFRGGRVAVFNYSVPKSASHYEIAAPKDRVTHIEGSNRWLAAAAEAATDQIQRSLGDNGRMAHIRPAYHGSLWIDPTSGSILRITIIAKTDESSNLDRAATLVDYGLVHMGEKSFVCPIRSFALSDAPSNVGTVMRGETTEWLNENLFTHYHLFVTSTQIVGRASSETKPAEASPRPGVAENPAPASTPTPQVLAMQPPEVASAISSLAQSREKQLPAAASPPAIAARPPQQSASLAPSPQPAATSGINKPKKQAVSSSPTAATPAPALFAAPSGPPSGSGLTLQVHVNEVLIPVVVRDAHGRSIDGLQKKDFRVFDDGKQRPVSGFLVEKYAASPREEGATTSEAETRTAASPGKMALPDRFTVYVFDDLNLTGSQIAYAQQAAIETMGDALRGTNLSAVVSTSGKINSGLTSNPMILANTIKTVRPVVLYRPDASECPKLDYYQADLIANKHDSTAIADAVQQDLTVCNAVRDRNIPQEMNPSLTELAGSSTSDFLAQAARANVESAARMVLQQAERNALITCGTLGEYVRKMARLPGQRTMILISPGFPRADATVTEAESRLINLADESGVIIDALNASGVNPGGLQASDNTSRIRNSLLKAEYREMEAQGKQNAIWDLADGTGGRFFHDDNDLAAGFREMLQAPKTVYLLELTLHGVKRNGAWHRLTVKADRAGAQVQARQGYFAPSKHAKRKADRKREFR